jgi:hypothetical protein
MTNSPGKPHKRGLATEAAKLAMSPLYGTGATPIAKRPSDMNGQIHERNGVWVVTIEGVWRGDYLQRDQAVAAVKDAGHRSWVTPG